MSEKVKVTKEKKVKRSSTKIEGLVKNRSAYLHFCGNERDKIKAEFPDIKSKDIIKVQAERWAVLKSDPDALQRLEELARSDKERYAKEKEEYYKLHPEEKAKASKKGKVSVDEDDDDEVEETVEEPVVVATPAPVVVEVKKPAGNIKFTNFGKVNRPLIKSENPTMSGKDITSELSKRWKSMSEEEKATYA